MDAMTATHAMETEAGVGLPNKKLGMWVFLCSEVMFFTGLIGATSCSGSGRRCGRCRARS